MQQDTVRHIWILIKIFVGVAIHLKLQYSKTVSQYKNCKFTVTEIYGLYIQK